MWRRRKGCAIGRATGYIVQLFQLPIHHGGYMLRKLPLRIALAPVLILNLVANPLILSAEQTPADVPSITIRTNTRLVVVDVVVTDKKGQPVPGLKADEFTVEENGKKHKKTMFVSPRG